MCFVHSGSGLVQQAVVGEAVAAAFSGVAAGDWSAEGMDIAGSGAPDVTAGPGGERVLDGYRQVLHNRWNRDLPPAAVVRPGEVIQLLCRDALDIGEAARTLTPEGTGRAGPVPGLRRGREVLPGRRSTCRTGWCP